MTPDGLTKIHEQLEGLGYLPVFEGSKNLRNTQTGVRIKIIITGDFPGDGKPKPAVAFPDPENAGEEKNGIRFLRLNALIELKLASGMTNPRRMQDLVDVQELIDVLKLPVEFAEKLSPFVRDKYRELWRIVEEHPTS